MESSYILIDGLIHIGREWNMPWMMYYMGGWGWEDEVREHMLKAAGSTIAKIHSIGKN